MEFVIHALDKPDREPLRLENRLKHVAYLKEQEDVTIMLAGPPLSDDGDHSIGSVLVVDAADRETVEKFATNDPYRKAGLFKQVSITHWVKTMG